MPTPDIAPSNAERCSSASRKAPYHPYLFSLISLCAFVELGFAVFMIVTARQLEAWPSPQFRILLIIHICNAVWSSIFASAYVVWMLNASGKLYFLAAIASSVIWLLVTTALWGTSAALTHRANQFSTCGKRPAHSQSIPLGSNTNTRADGSGDTCMQSLFIEGFGWAGFAICALTLGSTLWWVGSQKGKGKGQASFGVYEIPRSGIRR